MDPQRRVDDGYAYTCTFCKQSIPWPLTAEMLGFGPEEQPQEGKTYPYSRCYCGFGRFVLCQRTRVSLHTMQELIDKAAEH